MLQLLNEEIRVGCAPCLFGGEWTPDGLALYICEGGIIEQTQISVSGIIGFLSFYAEMCLL
jgi:hypothetical protein